MSDVMGLNDSRIRNRGLGLEIQEKCFTENIIVAKLGPMESVQSDKPHHINKDKANIKNLHAKFTVEVPNVHIPSF